MRNVTSMCMFLLFFATQNLWAGEAKTPLEVATRLVEQYRADGWTYGSDMKSKQINCVLFVVEVLKGAGVSDENVFRATRIEGIKGDLNQAVANGDDATKGIQYALTKHNLGSAVAIKDAKPGDFIQYWTYSDTEKKWSGHSGVIQSIKATGPQFKFDLMGAHKSRNGTGVVTPSLSLDPKRAKIYVARLGK